MKVEDLLKKGKEILKQNKIEEPYLIARVILQFVLKLDRNEILLKQEQIVNREKKREYEEVIQKIIDGIPMQYITNNQEFYGLNFYVDENVLIPQPDTEILVEEVLNISKEYKEKIEILDMCTGSGAIGISISKHLENAELTLTDISKEAIKIAKRNALSNNVDKKIEFIQSDMFEQISKKYDIIVSNPPYIETNIINTLSKQVKGEPRIALDGGEDGLKFYRILINESSKFLNYNGYLCMEIGYNQKEKVINLAKKSNMFKNIYSKKDLEGNDRIVICQKGTIKGNP